MVLPHLVAFSLQVALFYWFVLTGMTTTYMRFIPSVRKYYDQGAIVFLAMYNLITVSGYRDQNMLHMIFQRLYVIAIGLGLCIIMSILILPNWSGKDLQNSIISKIEALSKSISGIYSVYRATFFPSCDEVPNQAPHLICKF